MKNGENLSRSYRFSPRVSMNDASGETWSFYKNCTALPLGRAGRLKREDCDPLGLDYHFQLPHTYLSTRPTTSGMMGNDDRDDEGDAGSGWVFVVLVETPRVTEEEEAMVL